MQQSAKSEVIDLAAGLHASKVVKAPPSPHFWENTEQTHWCSCGRSSTLVTPTTVEGVKEEY